MQVYTKSMDHLVDSLFKKVIDNGAVISETPKPPTLNQREILDPLTNQISSNLTPEQNDELVELRKMKNARIGQGGGLELDPLDNVAEKKLVWLELKALGYLVSADPPIEEVGELKPKLMTPKKPLRKRI